MFDSIQLNARDYGVEWVEEKAFDTCIPHILQTRATRSFPRAKEPAHYLFDRSGGCGLDHEGETYPVANDNLVGYAGGISPNNVQTVIEKINETSQPKKYWIDMESGVRTNGLFDVKKIRAVLEAVYGQ